MQTLEEQVKEALVEKSAQEKLKLMQTPKYIDLIKKMNMSIIRSIFDAMPADEREGMTEDELAEFEAEMNEEICGVYSSPEMLQQQAYQSARNEYMGRADMEAKLMQLIGMGEDDFGEAAVAEFRKQTEKVMGYVNLREKYVSELVKIAERDGVEKAVTQEAQDEATRHIFPTKEAYIAYSQGSLAEIKGFLSGIQKAMKMDGEMGQMLGAMVGGIQQAVESMDELNDQIYAEKVQTDAKRIYGE